MYLYLVIIKCLFLFWYTQYNTVNFSFDTRSTLFNYYVYKKKKTYFIRESKSNKCFDMHEGYSVQFHLVFNGLTCCFVKLLLNQHVCKKIKSSPSLPQCIFSDEQFNLFLTVLLLCPKTVYRMSRKLLVFLQI